MNIGFHYHTTVTSSGDTLKVPGQIGVFLDELAKNCERLFLFLEESGENPNLIKENDYVLTQSNFVFVTLGNKSSFYKRLFWSWEKINIISKYASQFDFLLVRAPSPLLPLLFFKLRAKTQIYILLVGNYLNGISGLKQPFIRRTAIVLVLYIYNALQLLVIRRTHVFVNSKALYDDYKKDANRIDRIKTSTLTNDSFYIRTDTCQNSEIRILYAGRINYQKGLREIIESVSLLVNRFDIQIDIVGWEEQSEFSFQKALRDLASKLNIGERIHFHGKKRVGFELNGYYRKADIFILPSYHEGFPRTIWEAMANSLPVICTPVGGIPFELEDRVNAVFVKKRNIGSIVNAIEELITNADLRRTIIKNGFKKSAENTVEKQTGVLLNKIQNL